MARGSKPLHSEVIFEPLGRRSQVDEGSSLLEAARQAGVGLSALCGGKGSCGRCKVQLVSGTVSPLTILEEEALSPEEVAAGFRLACQTLARGPVKVYIPLESLTAPQRLQVEGQEVRVSPEPAVVAYPVALPPPSLEDQRSDAERLQSHLAQQYGLDDLSFDLEVLRRLPGLLRAQGWAGKAALRGREVISFHPSEEALLGLAVDLGTTKIAAYLVDLATGQTIASQGLMNPQVAYGEDVMSRIAHAMEGKGAELQRVVVEALNEIARDLCHQADGRPEQIVEVVVVGNTAMHHLFLGLPVAQLGLAPYLPAVSSALDLKAREAGLALAPGGYLHLLPNIAGFVGADHVAMLLATGIYQAQQVTLGLDIGTNTEITLATRGRLISCSCASGPAFEGRHIKQGMRAGEGAIERLHLHDSEVEYETIGGGPPVGLCGSGVLDAIAELVRLGVVDERGAMKGHPRLRRSQEGPEFVLVGGEESGTGKDIVITRGDIGEIQLAKGAIRAGINILLREANLSARDVEKVVVAGAFGTYIDISSAVRIGMFPSLPEGRFLQVGNAAGTGARLALLSKSLRSKAGEIARQVKYLELSNHPHFSEEFARAMRLSDET